VKYNNINKIEILNIEEYNKDIISSRSVSLLGILERNEEILYGELPTDSDEIILSYPALLELINVEYKITKQEYNNYSNDEKEALISKIFSNEYVIRLNDNYLTRIVGIYNSSENKIKIVNKIYKEDIQPKVSVAYFYLTDYKDANDVRDVFKDSEYTYTLFAEHIRGKIINDTRIIQRIMVIITIVLIVITIIQMNAFIKIRIIESEYDVGILKTLGAKGRHIFYIFSIEAVLLALSSTILSLIIYIFGVQIISSEVTNLSIIDFTLPGINILIIGVLACIISVLSVSKHLLSISRLSPIEAIRRR
jgi:cell division protein FtsX